jgi:hypothetical protein
MQRTIFTLIFLAGYASWVDAGVYKWVDADGGVHYGDHPPPQSRSPRSLAIDSCDSVECRTQQQRAAEEQDRRGLDWLRQREALQRRREQEAQHEFKRYERELRKQDEDQARQQRRKREQDEERRARRIRILGR